MWAVFILDTNSFNLHLRQLHKKKQAIFIHCQQDVREFTVE